MRAVSLARLYEDKYNPNFRPNPAPNIYRHQSSTPPIKTNAKPNPRNTSPPLLLSPTHKPTFNPPKNQVRRLSPAEQQLRRDKGLYFWCDEKFIPNHRCLNRHFMLYQLEETEDAENQQRVNTPEELDPDHQLTALEHHVLQQHHLSLNAMKGVPVVATIRLTAKVHGLELQVLIDGDNFDSFIQPRIVEFLKFPMEPALGFKVMVGNFDGMDVEGRIPSVQVKVQGQTLDIPNVYVLQVAGGDLVIGSSWLETLKGHIADYDSLFIRFLNEGEFVTLNGDDSSYTSSISSY